MKTVSLSEAKIHFSRLLKRAHAGEEIILTKNGKPYARLCPLEAPSLRLPGLLQGKVGKEFFEALPEEELRAWEG
jgi:prevent-host-death family protein